MKRGNEALNTSLLQFYEALNASSLHRYKFLLLLFKENRRLTLHRRYFFKEIHRLTLHCRYFFK
jgi:hypothetical protein